MNKYRFCLSTSKKHVILDDIGQHFLDCAVHLVKAGKKFVYVVDNIDWEEKVHDMRQDYQNKSVHAVATSIVFSRVSSNQLPDNGPQKDIHKCNVREVVSMSAEELKDIQYRYRMFVARLLIEKFSELASLHSLLASEIELKHEHSDVTANKSEIMTLPILMKDEKKYSDCVDVLDQLEEWMHDIYKASGLYKETKSPATSGSVQEMSTQPDQPRGHVPPAQSENDPLAGIKIPCYGDELTRVRFAGARHLSAGCHTAKQHLDHLYPYRIVGWHTKRSFLKVCVFIVCTCNFCCSFLPLKYVNDAFALNSINKDIPGKSQWNVCVELLKLA